MRRIAASLFLGLLLAVSSLAVPQTAKKEAGLRCTLTGKKIEKCCCEQRDGKLYCPLAKKLIEKCCCTADEAKAKKSAKQ